MAYAEQLKSGRWRGRYRDGTGKLRTAPKTYPTRKLAKTAAANLEADISRNVWTDPRAGHVTYAKWVEKWWEEYRSAEETSNATARARLDRTLIPTWGEAFIDGIDQPAVQAWVKRLGKSTMAARTVKAHVDLLSASMAAAVAAKLIRANPCRGVRLPTPPSATETYYPLEEFRAIAAQIEQCAGRPDRVVAEVLFWTGLRWGEAAGLHVPAVNLKAGTIDVTCVLVELGTRKFVKPYTKGKRRRTVGIPAPLLPLLVEHLGDLEKAKTCGFEHAEGKCRGGLVFRHWQPRDPKSGRPRAEPGMVSRHHFGHYVWKPALAALADTVQAGRVHDLRHSHASYLAQRGITLVEIQEQLGHESITTTQRYAHLCESTTRIRIMGVLDHDGGLRAVPDSGVEQDVEQNSGQRLSTTVNDGGSGEPESPAV